MNEDGTRAPSLDQSWAQKKNTLEAFNVKIRISNDNA